MANEIRSWSLRLKTKALAEMELIKAGGNYYGFCLSGQREITDPMVETRTEQF